MSEEAGKKPENQPVHDKTVHPGAKVIEARYESGSPDSPDRWTSKLKSVEDVMRYIKTAERYFCDDPANWYGSEKRRTPA